MNSKATAVTMYAGGGASLATGLGLYFWSNHLENKTVRVFNEQANLRSRISLNRPGLELALAF